MSVQRSETIDKLATALAKAQLTLTGASKDSVNPHFKSKYADLASVWEACQQVLPANGLAVLQPVSGGADGTVTVTTLLVHHSGEYVGSELTLRAVQDTPQGLGSCITYARRYGLASLVGVAPEDDDGNAASKGPGPNRPMAVVRPEPDGYAGWMAELTKAAEGGEARLREAWTGAQPAWRAFAHAQDRERLDALKVKAAAIEAAS